MIFSRLVLFMCLGQFLSPVIGAGQSVAINPLGIAADTSAILDINSPKKGLLIPRLTTPERNAIFHPARALMIFNTTTGKFEVNTGTMLQPVWESVVTLETLQAQNQFWNNGGNAISGDIGLAGTANAKSFGLISNNTIRLFIDSVSGRIGLNTQAPKASLHIAATDALVLPSGTTGQRPAAPVVGMIRYNSETGKLEGYSADGWKSLQ